MANRYNRTPIQIDENKNRYYTTTLYPEIPPNINDIYLAKVSCINKIEVK